MPPDPWQYIEEVDTMLRSSCGVGLGVDDVTPYSHCEPQLSEHVQSKPDKPWNCAPKELKNMCFLARRPRLASCSTKPRYDVPHLSTEACIACMSALPPAALHQRCATLGS